MRATYIPIGLLAVALVHAEADSKPPKPPKAAPAAKPHANTGPGGGPPAPKRASDEQIEKLAQMPTAQREKALANLPPGQRARVEAGLKQWNSLTPEQKARVQKMRNLPPETRKKIKDLSDKIRALPNDRKAAVTKEIQRLQTMSPEQREKRLNSAGVQKNFSPEEQEILRESPNVLPPYYF